MEGEVLVGFLVFPSLNSSVCHEDRYLDIRVLAPVSCFGLSLNSTVVPPRGVLPLCEGEVRLSRAEGKSRTRGARPVSIHRALPPRRASGAGAEGLL